MQCAETAESFSSLLIGYRLDLRNNYPHQSPELEPSWDSFAVAEVFAVLSSFLGPAADSDPSVEYSSSAAGCCAHSSGEIPGTVPG